MSLLFASPAADTILNALRTYIEGQTGRKSLRIYAGAVPASIDANLTSDNLLLAEFTMADTNPASAGKTLVLTNPADVTALLAGTATFFRLGVVVSGAPSAAILQGSVSDAAGAGELKLNKVAFVKDEPVSITRIALSIA